MDSKVIFYISLKMPLTKGKPLESLGIPISEAHETILGSIVSGMRSRQVDSLSSAINDLNFLISEREALSKDLLKDIDKLRIEFANFMLEAGNSILLPEKLELRKKLLEIEEVRLKEKLDSWRDISALKKELRERQKELSEKEANISAIERIME